jgi:NAD+ kinase
MITIGIVSDIVKSKVREFKEAVISKYNLLNLDDFSCEAKNVDVILVLGGDGFFLHTIHKFLNYKKPFYGINYGTVGFLLNEIPKIENLIENVKNANPIKLNLLEAEIQTKNNVYKSLAMNEVTLFRSSGQIAKLKIYIDGKLRIKELASDGIVLSTAAGSTAYNFSLHGPIFSPDSKVLSLCPISPFRPRHFRGAMLLETSKVKFEVMESQKRPVLATTDFTHFQDVESLSVSLSKKHFVTLLFNKDKSLNEKILEEQFLI